MQKSKKMEQKMHIIFIFAHTKNLFAILLVMLNEKSLHLIDGSQTAAVLSLSLAEGESCQ